MRDVATFGYADVREGDEISMPVIVRRKWWELWKPRTTVSGQQTFRVIAVRTNRLTLDR